MKWINKNTVKRLTKECGEFVKNNKISTGLWFVAGMAFAAKSYPLAIALNIAGLANYLMDRQVDAAIAAQTVECWRVMTPEQRRTMIRMANLYPDIPEERIEQMVNDSLGIK